MRALVIGNVDDLDTGFVGSALRRRGWHLTERVREDHAEWPRHDPSDETSHDLAGVDLVLALGSSWSTYWDHVAAAVRAEQSLMRVAIDSGRGVLGLCFGAQQLATVLGGSVARAPHPEIGWHRVQADARTPDHSASEMLAGEWLQWHYDAFDLPPGIEPLVVSSAGPQAFVSGRCAGFQFHPEVTEAMVRAWSAGEGAAELEAVGVQAGALAAETAVRRAEMEGRTDRLVEWYLRQVCGASTAGQESDSDWSGPRG